MAPISSSVPKPWGVLTGMRVLIYSGWLSPDLWKMLLQHRPLQQQKWGVLSPNLVLHGKVGVSVGSPPPPWDLAFRVSRHFPKGDTCTPGSRRGAFRWYLGEFNCDGYFFQCALGRGPQSRATVAQARLLRWSCMLYPRPAARAEVPRWMHY